MGAPDDPESPDEAASSQEEPPPVTGVPVVALPPSLDYVPWSTGPCDCFSDCDQLTTMTPLNYWIRHSCLLSGAIYFLIAIVTGCSCCYSFLYRLKMREKYRIVGNAAEDFVLHCLCEACALAQEYRELENRGFDPSLGWRESVKSQNHGVAMAPMPPVAPVVEDGMKR